MKQNCKSQVGRSMIEMLGVLFVIGILSIGGIVTYRIAMRNILGNDILDLVSVFISHFPILFYYNQIFDK